MQIHDLVSKRREFAEDVRGLANGFDSIVVDDDCPVAEDSGLGIHSEDYGIVEYE